MMASAFMSSPFSNSTVSLLMDLMGGHKRILDGRRVALKSFLELIITWRRKRESKKKRMGNPIYCRFLSRPLCNFHSQAITKRREIVEGILTLWVRIKMENLSNLSYLGIRTWIH